MPLNLRNEQIKDLALLQKQTPANVVELCKAAFDYLVNGSNAKRNEVLATKYSTTPEILKTTVEALVSLLLDATKHNASDLDIKQLQREAGFNDDTLEVLAQFVTSKRSFVEGSIKSANLRSYRLVNIEWRLETRIASRCLLKQNNIIVTMKLYLHTEPKNENRDLLAVGENNVIHPDERHNRKDLIVQTDISSLSHIIQTLEDALMESRTRRIRNIVDAIH